MNVTFSDSFEDFIDLGFPSKIVYSIIFILFELLGLSCYLGFIHFEHYGGDPMKRSIKNKLISQSFIVLMMEIVIYNSAFAWRIIIRPLNTNVCLFVLFIHNFFAIVVAICITEFISFKVFMLYGWKYFCSMDEGFLSQTILTFNFLFGFCTQYCRWTLGSLETHVYELLSGILLSNKSINHIRYFWPISLVISLSIILIGILALSIKKYKVYIANKNMVQEIHITLENQQSNNFNNKIHNKPLLGTGTMLRYYSSYLCMLWQIEIVVIL